MRTREALEAQNRLLKHELNKQQGDSRTVNELKCRIEELQKANSKMQIEVENIKYHMLSLIKSTENYADNLKYYTETAKNEKDTYSVLRTTRFHLNYINKKTDIFKEAYSKVIKMSGVSRTL